MSNSSTPETIVPYYIEPLESTGFTSELMQGAAGPFTTCASLIVKKVELFGILKINTIHLSLIHI